MVLSRPAGAQFVLIRFPRACARGYSQSPLRGWFEFTPSVHGLALRGCSPLTNRALVALRLYDFWLVTIILWIGYHPYESCRL